MLQYIVQYIRKMESYDWRGKPADISSIFKPNSYCGRKNTALICVCLMLTRYTVQLQATVLLYVHPKTKQPDCDDELLFFSCSGLFHTLIASGGSDLHTVCSYMNVVISLINLTS